MSVYHLLLLTVILGVQAASASQDLQARPVSPSVPNVEVAISKAGFITLDVHDATIAQSIDALAAKTGKPIRYRDAPDHTVSVSCHGQGLETVLRCLLGTDADLAFSYDDAAPGRAGHGPLAGVKILSSTFLKLSPHASTDSTQLPPGQPLSAEAALALTRSEDPDQRARALDQIGRFEQIDKATLEAAYNDALKDKDGDVRAAAVNGLALLDEKASFPLLSSAMTDESASVRLAALDGMDVDEQSLPFIAEALSDPDESVRTLAQLRLGIE